jgi:hypothetical protein
MIDWKVVVSETEIIKGYFPDFNLQEYLLPIINVGGSTFDEYGRTVYSSEDCIRLRNTISFAKETILLTTKVSIRYETINDGLVVLQKEKIVEVLNKLDFAAKAAIDNHKYLEFLGD